ncbi:hypothetical protein OSTOST_10796, partial [Ostertagia ostertagi]
LQRKYKRLVHALPPLPSPTRLYKKIVNCCRHLHKTTRNMSTLMERIKNLWKSQEDWKEKLVELQLIETLTEKTLLEFKLIRTELRTLFAVPPLLIATDIISENNWKAIISQTQFDEEENSILTKHETIETVIEDQMEILHEQQSILNDYRRMLQEEERKATRTFQTTVLASLNQLRETLEQESHLEKDSKPSTEILMDIKEEITTLLQNSMRKNTRSTLDDEAEHWAGEGNDNRYKELPSRDEDDEMYSETERINAEYMEGVQDMTEDELNGDSVTTPNQLWKERIWNDLEEAEREVKKMENIVYELDMEPTCNPRDYRKGIIQREDERGMVCTFCGKVGEHYSDSCEAYPSSKERLKIVEAEDLCKTCLRINSENHGLRCFHCNEYGHHSALCELPEKSEYIRRRIKEAIERRKNAKERIKELYRQLDEIQ